MSRARNLAGFVTAITPVADLQVGVITATRFDGPFDGGTVGYANTAGIATVAVNAQGLIGNPDINTGDINATNIDGDRLTISGGANITGVVTAASFVGDGSELTGVGGGLGRPVNTTFNTVGLVTTFNSNINLNDATAGVGSHFVTVTEPILEVGPTGDITVGADKILVVDPVQLAPWS